MSSPSSIVVVVGNPKIASRTLQAAEAVADRAAAAAGIDPADRTVIEVAELGASLFDWSSAEVRARVEQLSAARLAVIASPVYKATYTGLLKSFLDWFGQTGLDGVTAIPVMVGAAANHALAVELHLRPLLVEIGASLPTRGVYVIEDQLETVGEVVEDWAATAAPVLSRAVRSA